MAGAVVEIEAGLPQRETRQDIQRRACRAFREAHAREGDVALQHASVALLHLFGRIADGERAGDVGCAVEILAA